MKANKKIATIFYIVFGVLFMGFMVFATTISDSGITTTGSINFSNGMDLVTGRDANGENILRFIPLNSSTGYTQFAFYPEGNTSFNGSDVMFNAHKTLDNGEVHKHFSIYTRSPLDSSKSKRLDIDYGVDYADITWQNGDDYSIGANRFRVNDISNVTWGFMDLRKSGASVLFDFSPNSSTSTDSASIRYFRDTDLDGEKYLSVYKGDGTSTSTFLINASTGDILTMGDIREDIDIYANTLTLDDGGGSGGTPEFDLNGRAKVMFDGSSGSAVLEGGSGKKIQLRTDGANTRLEISSAGQVVINNLQASYTGGSAYVCVYNNGTLYASESACP